MGDEIDIVIYNGYKITYDPRGKVFKATTPDGEYFDGDKSQEELQNKIDKDIKVKIKKQEAFLKRYGGLTKCSINSINVEKKTINITFGDTRMPIYQRDRDNLYKVNPNNWEIAKAIDKARADIKVLETFIYEELKKVTEPITYEALTKV